MPKNKTQRIIFGIIMSYSMAVGMEIYNNAIQQGVHLQPGGFTNLTYGIVGKALVEALFMGLIVIIVSELWGNRLGARFAAKVSDPQRDNPYFCRLMRQAGTVSVMCPTMSLAATIIFSMILGGALTHRGQTNRLFIAHPPAASRRVSIYGIGCATGRWDT